MAHAYMHKFNILYENIQNSEKRQWNVKIYNLAEINNTPQSDIMIKEPKY